ncbi:uncharacterized protein LOC132615785 [Lycium barbarum]|uniref:uncharacterized protein LOC132615785 n=1 Tax=Lycium barbarum TaxID=112863 RepID=UPI00293E7160|nr:uncharacterized protein LOC132615785 [Lycium barbarum]
MSCDKTEKVCDKIQKITIMVLKLKVDLQCSCSYKKIKKILCNIDQIRDQVYDEKVNTVTIKVICCSPEKIRDKLCCKECEVIESVEIKKPDEEGDGSGPSEEPPTTPEPIKVLVPIQVYAPIQVNVNGPIHVYPRFWKGLQNEE